MVVSREARVQVSQEAMLACRCTERYHALFRRLHKRFGVMSRGDETGTGDGSNDPFDTHISSVCKSD